MTDSTLIDAAFVSQFSALIYLQAQQKGSRLRPHVRNESQVGQSAFYERIAKTAAVKRVSRHADTPLTPAVHSRRMVTLVDYEWSDLIDKQDKIRTLIDPTGTYTQSAIYALGRSMDDEIIKASNGTAYSGPTGTTSVSLGTSQQYGSFDGSSTAGVNLNVRTLRAVKKQFMANDVDENIPMFACVGSSQIASLLGETEVTNSQYATIKALVNGEVDSFMGFKFIRSERLNTTSAVTTFNSATGSMASGSDSFVSGARQCFFWSYDGLLLAVGMDIMARVDERPDKGYSMQVYTAMSASATRMEEEKVVSVLCNEAV